MKTFEGLAEKIISTPKSAKVNTELLAQYSEIALKLNNPQTIESFECGLRELGFKSKESRRQFVEIFNQIHNERG